MMHTHLSVTYSWLEELDPSEQASNTRYEVATNRYSTPRNGRKPTRHTGSSAGGHACGKKITSARCISQIYGFCTLMFTKSVL